MGTVISIRSQAQSIFQEADIKSAIDFNRLETVLIITNFQAPDLEPILATPAPP